MPTADVGDSRAALKLCHDAVERRQPGGHEVGLIARPKEASGRAEQTLRLIAPADALASTERRFDKRLVFQHDRRHIEGGLQIDGTVRLGKHHRLFRRQGELAAGGLVFEITRRGLMRQPLARVAFGDARLRCQFRRRHGTPLFERLVEAELVAHPHQRRAEHAAEIAQNFADELVQFGLVNHRRLLRCL